MKPYHSRTNKTAKEVFIQIAGIKAYEEFKENFHKYHWGVSNDHPTKQSRAKYLSVIMRTDDGYKWHNFWYYRGNSFDFSKVKGDYETICKQVEDELKAQKRRYVR